MVIILRSYSQFKPLYNRNVGFLGRLLCATFVAYVEILCTNIFLTVVTLQMPHSKINPAL